MESSFSSRRQLSVQQADSTTGGTDDGPHQLSTITEIPLIRNKKLPKVCKRCKKIDFKAAFGMTLFSPEFVFFLGKLEKEGSCILCRFFYSMRCRPKENKRHGEIGVYTLRSYDFKTILTGTDSAAYDVHGCAHSRVLCVLAGEPDYYEGDHEFPTSGHWIVPQVSSTGPFFDSNYAEPHLTALPFFPGSINYSLLRAWCERCDNHHETCASGTTKTGDKQSAGPVVRCIDCHTREVVEINTSDRYLALSYVWGAQSAPVSADDIGTTQTLSPKSVRLLPNAIPKLIEDAMIVVNRLGERYLWVDQYCIDQNNADEKHAQIENMAFIYEGAYATIVAFSASNSASGLRGVNNLPRKPYPSVPQTKHPCPLSALRPSAINSAQLVASSVWMTRGWTYQEAILSRRLLFFTDYQVEFICSNAVWHECTVPQMEGKYSGGRRRALGVNFLRAISPTERPEWDDITPVSTEELFGYIEEYSGRHLSYQSDALNAITGLLSRISVVTYLGIPVYDASDFKELERRSPTPIDVDAYKQSLLVEFLVCLTWYPAHESLLRRDAFPSWSWLGWEGQVKFPDIGPGIYGYGAEVSSLWIPQQVTHDNGEIQVPFLQFLQGNLLDEGTTSVLPHVSKYLWVEGPVMKMSFALEQSIPNGSRHESFVFRNSRPSMSVMEWGLWDSPRISYRTCKPDSQSQETMHQRVITEEWDCLLLAFRTLRGEFHGHFLILDQIRLDADTEAEDYHSVVGSAELHLVSEELNKQPLFIEDLTEQEFGPGSFSGISDPTLRRKIKLG
ncbi:heterokaryon incompatibility protein-domain-containing protein [Neurospora tetraspora]|uniref:Heterokaryon incompatibility protein-domain-containing protein n=1 Tax=Neurospora tetraspora TaxID=94610 RepID=A0AAE0JEW0_9PEZI|nr:heterokaryon incompatibility protein-domain-containing protein [Neurospora tetraspora]